MMVVHVGPTNQPMPEKDLNWALQPILLPMQCIGLVLNNGNLRHFLLRWFHLCWLLFSTGLQLFLLAQSVLSGMLDRFYALFQLSVTYTNITKIDCSIYAVSNIVSHVIIVFELGKKLGPLFDTYRQIEYKFNFHLYAEIRKLSIIALVYVIVLVSFYRNTVPSQSS